ncbi:virion structural protein [Bacillus phage Shbh1]|uniref:Uncharacterized protein n=1 Tax=Bacillus phage Shbh1 TaxID=1796992 RepID=A0A142F1F3_9CAUD|nr:virion structural protein [Bacillus phage Shbh1]AMQ66610.1 hypothetical protein [Bacillus phage Shbh1]
MPMSDGRNRLRKIAFQVGSRFFRFAINPENYIHKIPHRTTTIKTKSRIVVEDFQNDVPTISIKGSTGFNPTGRASDRGINKIKEMKAFLERYSSMGGNGNTPAQDFYFHNFTNDESFVIHLSSDGVSYTQDVNSPLTYNYEINFVILRKAGQPSDEEVISPEIGNRFPSIPIPDPISRSPIPIHPTLPTGGSTPPPNLGNVYNDGTNREFREWLNSEVINPQAPSRVSYELGRTGLGYLIGYYGRSY